MNYDSVSDKLNNRLMIEFLNGMYKDRDNKSIYCAETIKENENMDKVAISNLIELVNHDNIGLENTFIIKLVAGYFVNNLRKLEVKLVLRELYKNLSTRRFVCDLIYDNLEFHSDINYEHKNDLAKKQAHYPYIALSPDMFINGITQTINCLKKYKITPKTFFDVGCGIGTKLMLAEIFFDLTAFGIEYTKETYHAGRFRLLNFLSYDYFYQEDSKERGKLDRIILGNVLEYKDYSKYDLIYFYCPMRISTMMFELYKTIILTMKDNSCFVSFLTVEKSLERAFKECNVEFKGSKNISYATLVVKSKGVYYCHKLSSFSYD